MKSYIAKLIFNLDINNGADVSQFEEQVRFIHANSIHEAWIKAKAIGESETARFVNPKNEMLHWQFVDVLELFTLDQIHDGQQLYTNSRIEKDAVDFKAYVHLKSEWIQKKSSIFASKV